LVIFVLAYGKATEKFTAKVKFSGENEKIIKGKRSCESAKSFSLMRDMGNYFGRR
jgi:hypothetical protein